MAPRSERIVGVLGPTNTGKTHLAIERLCAHSSGLIGFPLRLLAREVYDRVVAIKGRNRVGLITGEEKIVPPDARWLLCTAESMPRDGDHAFVALDEAQLCADRERGHIFTDRILHARGREETLILGSEMMRPVLRTLVPDAEIVTRPRFSQLSFAGAKKLSRLPSRSVIVAFSAEHVYATAELLRRARGGAAVVMGSLSPATRNAQVALYQSGEVDYLVATDAIGMGLNMDVHHVAFASLTKFDGKRQRRLTPAEIAQIAGRAGRHQRDGTFGSLLGGPDGAAFSEEEIERIEEHRFRPLDHAVWRNPELDFSSIEALIDSLEKPPDRPMLRAAPEAIDLAVLRILASPAQLRDFARDPPGVARLWEVCGLPDFRKVGAEHHARLVGQIFTHLRSGDGFVPDRWFAGELTRLESVQGDVETLAGRVAAVRTWAYVANRRDWLRDPAPWIARAGELEQKLSDALHARLVERFVDRRTSILMRTVRDDPALLDVEIDGEGRVLVEDQAIGTLDGFRFHPDAAARVGDRKRLLAAAALRLPKERARRAERLAADPDAAFSLATEIGAAPVMIWQGSVVATFRRGRSLLDPQIVVAREIADLPEPLRMKVGERLGAWLSGQLAARLGPLIRIADATGRVDTAPGLRSILALVLAEGGHVPRDQLAGVLAGLDRQERATLRRLGIVIGTLDLFHPGLLKPEAVRWRLALTAIRRNIGMPPVPLAGLGLLDKPADALIVGAGLAGFRRFGAQMLRIDLVERIARAAHDARGSRRTATIDPALAVSMGIGQESFMRIMRAIGFQPGADADATIWRWRGTRRPPAVQGPLNPSFAALSALRGQKP